MEAQSPSVWSTPAAPGINNKGMGTFPSYREHGATETETPGSGEPSAARGWGGGEWVVVVVVVGGGGGGYL